MSNNQAYKPGFSFDRPWWSYVKVQKIIAAIKRNKRFLISKNISSKEYLDVGCGPNTHSDFISLDYGWNPKVDICWDATRGLPFDDNSLTGIFTEHCLEHLDLESVNKVLFEFWRVLKPGGTVRLIVPDGELYLRNYVRIQDGDEGAHLPYSETDRFQDIYTPIMSINRIFRGHGHQFIFDYQTFERMLIKCRFANIKKESYKCGRDKNLLIDMESRVVESLYVEASKPE
jgi:predicted SAM-dependent methyltransferase